jgi:Glucose-6-phosphate dehydrogenase subunit N-terminal domain/Glucose-6-phosphate dehydrogenase subunit C-terminal domain
VSAEPGTDRSTWAGRGVGIDQIEAELDRLHRDHQREGHALARTLNLIVAPGPRGSDQSIDATLAGLGDHSPSRTLVLRRHAADRLDADAALECRVPAASGRVGICHDQVVLSADEARLGHAASLLAPLLLRDLPTVLWLPDEPGSPIPDPRLLDRVQHVLIDSAVGPVPARRMAELARRVPVHDLAWGRLEFWRAATAAAFEPLGRRRLIGQVTQLELAYGEGARPASVLLAGWVAARAGWRAEPLDDWVGAASRPDGGTVDLLLRPDVSTGDCGGIHSLVFHAGSKEVRVDRGAATSRLRDLFGEALQPLPAYSRGYREAVEAAVVIGPAEQARA